MTETESPHVISSPPKNVAAGKPPAEEDPDLALARILQEQERAYFMLSQGSQGMDEEESGANLRWQGVDREEEEEPLDDEQLATRMQMEEDRAAYMALYGGTYSDYNHGAEDEQDTAEAADNLSYEELQALGDCVGTVSKGLGAEDIEQLPTKKFDEIVHQNGPDTMDRCCVCQIEFEGPDSVLQLPCNHFYHMDCISTWLGMNKTCPNCFTEVKIGETQKKT